MSGHTHLPKKEKLLKIQMTVPLWRNLNVYQQTKNELHPSHFLYDIAKILQTCCTRYFGHAWLITPKVILSTSRKLVFIWRQKINFISHALLEILQRYANLFWVLWGCLVTHNQNDSINLWKTSIFICTPKIHFIIHFFLEMLCVKESCNLIGWQHFGP